MSHYILKAVLTESSIDAFTYQTPLPLAEQPFTDGGGVEQQPLVSPLLTEKLCDTASLSISLICRAPF